MDLEHSLWIGQSHVNKQGDDIERKLFFRPWLDSVAGEYTCHVFMKNHPHATTYNKTFVITGMWAYIRTYDYVTGSAKTGLIHNFMA